MIFVIIQPHLEYGGAERQTVLLANRLVREGHECHIVLHHKKGGLIGDLDTAVQIWDLGLENHLAFGVTAIRLQRVLQQIPPAFVIVKLWSSILATALVDSKNPQHVFNYCEDLDPSDHATFIRMGKTKQWIIGKIFRRKLHLTANTMSVAESMMDEYDLKRQPAVISSVVEADQVATRAESPDARRLRCAPDSTTLRVCSVGSLIPRKGLDITRQALERASRSRTIEWHIIGEGPMRGALSSPHSTPNMQVQLHGGMPNPYGIIKDCDLLIHSAVSEAFGIVILEALALGVSVIAADAIGPTEMRRTLGPNEKLLTLYPGGDSDALAELVQRFDLSEREPIQRYRDYIRFYELESTVRKWVQRAETLTAKR